MSEEIVEIMAAEIRPHIRDVADGSNIARDILAALDKAGWVVEPRTLYVDGSTSVYVPANVRRVEFTSGLERRHPVLTLEQEHYIQEPSAKKDGE